MTTSNNSDYYTEDGDVVCQECGHVGGQQIFKHLSSEHDMSKEEYQEEHPGAPVVNDEFRDNVGRTCDDSDGDDCDYDQIEDMNLNEVNSLLNNLEEREKGLEQELEEVREQRKEVHQKVNQVVNSE